MSHVQKALSHKWINFNRAHWHILLLLCKYVLGCHFRRKQSSFLLPILLFNILCTINKRANIEYMKESERTPKPHLFKPSI